MIDKFVTRLHEINDNPKTRLILDFAFITLLTLVLVYCILGVQGCFGSRTVYAAEEDTVDVIFDESLPACTIPSSFDFIYGFYYKGVVSYDVIYGVNDYNYSFRLDSDNLIRLYFSDLQYSGGHVTTYSWNGSDWYISSPYRSSTISLAISPSDFRGSSLPVLNTDGSVYLEPTIKTSLPPFSLETFATDYIPLVTNSIIDVFVAFAKFCVESPVVIASIALSFIGYAIVKARDSVRGV